MQCAACRLADIAAVAAAITIVALLAAPMLRPDLDVLDTSLSYYADGPWGKVQSLAFVAIGVALISLAFALALAVASSPWLALCSTALVTSGLASFGLVLFPMGAPGPHTIIGDAHMSVGFAGAAVQLAGALAFLLAIWALPAWSAYRAVGIAVVAVSLISALASQLAVWRPDLGIPMGGTIRLFVAPLILYWGAVALRLRQACSA